MYSSQAGSQWKVNINEIRTSKWRKVRQSVLWAYIQSYNEASNNVDVGKTSCINDWGITCIEKYRISKFKNRNCKVLNTTVIASGYAGRYPQGERLTMEACCKFSLVYLKWLKV